jgi:hypothetical protein
MEQPYKRHRIQVLAGLNGGSWITNLRIFCQKGATHTFMIFAMNKEFATYGQAIEAGIMAGRNWVDDSEIRRGSKTTRLCAHSKRLREHARLIQQISRSTVAKSKIIYGESVALYLKMRPFALPIRAQ